MNSKDKVMGASLFWGEGEMEQRVGSLHYAGSTKRLHTVSTVRPHTIGEHVYGAQCIAVELCRLNEVEPGRVLQWLLYHDSPESVTGDIPAPVKRGSESIEDAIHVMEDDYYEDLGIELPFLGDRERLIAKASDTLDLGFACVHERSLGNGTLRMSLMFHNVLEYLGLYYNTVVGVRSLAKALIRAWRLNGGTYNGGEP